MDANNNEDALSLFTIFRFLLVDAMAISKLIGIQSIETYCQTIIIYISQEFVKLKLKMQKILQKVKRMSETE